MSADWPASLLAVDATIVLQGPGGQRHIAATDFFLGFYETALSEGELITEIRIDLPAAGTRSTYVKFFQPASRFAIVGCAAIAEPGGKVRVAFTGVSDAAFRDEAVEKALAGKPLTAANIEAAAALAAEGVSIMSDHFASERYRKHLAKVYCKRALMAIAG
jgi:aerobic carbon-monoxide dehydrogenase medium subunit